MTIADLVPPQAPRRPTAPAAASPYPADLTQRPDPDTAPTTAWQRHYHRLLVAVDLAVILISAFVALRVRFSGDTPSFNGLSYTLFSAALVPVWFAALVTSRAYESRYLGTGAEEFKRVGSASLRLMAVVAVVAYAFKLQLARGYVALAFPLGTVLLLLGRYALRRWLHGRRRRGECLHRVVAVGGADGVKDLAAQFDREPYAGFQLVGACLPAAAAGDQVAGAPVLGTLTEVIDAVRASGADTVAVASGPGMSPTVLRRLSWELEGTGVSLVVAPALTDVAGPRITIRPVAGLPLLHVEEPELSGIRQRAKAVTEWIVAAAASTLLLPVIGLLALAVRLDSPGAPLFRQTRVGRHGREFTVYKLRTMRVDAESLLDTLRHENEAADGPTFKIRRDPRVTRIGRLLRRYSLDELPQLWNVVRGDMAIIGPRPPLPCEVARYGEEAARRLLVRPGMTGLWQVSGRSDLTWDDSVRLDLYYVENWSLALDLMILWKTFFAIVTSAGAY